MMKPITRSKQRWVMVLTLCALPALLSAAPFQLMPIKITSVPVGTTAPKDKCNADCVIEVRVILLNDDPNSFVCQTFLDYATYKPTRGNTKKVVWQIVEGLQAGDKAKYVFDTEGVKRLPQSANEPDDFEDRVADSSDKKKFHWKLKDITTKTPTHFEFHIVQMTNGSPSGKCKPQDPVILNDG
jgi:hypothetical protein